MNENFNKLIYNEQELKYFFDNILYSLQRDEVFFVSLSARNKYLTTEERVELNLGRTEMFERRIIREYNWNKFLRTIKKFETVEGSYTTKNNSIIPLKSIICYININPSSVIKAYMEFNKIMMDYMYEMTTSNDKQNVLTRITKADVLFMNCLQKSRGTKHFIDIDMDIPEERIDILNELTNDLHKNGVKYYVIKTKSGFHVLLKKETIKYNFTEKIMELSFFNQDFEIIINKNEMIPIPGTLQGGFPVKIIGTNNE